MVKPKYVLYDGEFAVAEVYGDKSTVRLLGKNITARQCEPDDKCVHDKIITEDCEKCENNEED